VVRAVTREEMREIDRVAIEEFGVPSVALMESAGRAVSDAVAALLITGKLFCLMAALLIFAPRALYAGAEAGGASHVKVSDQQLAGLIMAVICPLAYVGSAVVVTTRWLLALPQTEDAP